MRKFADIVALKANDPYCYFCHGREGETQGRGEVPGEILQPRFFHAREMLFSNRDGATNRAISFLC